MRAALALALLLAGCSDGQAPAADPDATPDLESAAIARGLVRDPADREVAGLYARDTDRLCVVQDGMAYRVGAYVDYGEGITCSGAGKATRAGETLQIELGGDCGFEARFDGDKIAFPGALPAGCQRLCSGRASLAGLDVTRLSESTAEAAAMRDSGGRRLCGD